MESSVMKLLIFENFNLRLVSKNLFLIPLVISIKAKILKKKILHNYPVKFFHLCQMLFTLGRSQPHLRRVS